MKSGVFCVVMNVWNGVIQFQRVNRDATLVAIRLEEMNERILESTVPW